MFSAHAMSARPCRLIALTALATALAGCDLAEITGEAKVQAAREAEGKALGSACRHAGRAIEDCYAKSPKVSKAAIFNGWREMDAYMRENNIQVVLPDALKALPAPDKKAADESEEATKAADAADEKKKVAADEKAKAAPPADTKAKATDDKTKAAAAAADAKKKPAAAAPPAKAPASGGTTA